MVSSWRLVAPKPQAGRASAILILLQMFVALCFALAANAQAPPNPVPFVHQPLVPSAVAPGGPGFTLTVNGAGFVPESVVNWNGSPRPTSFVSNTQLTAAIDAADIATVGTARITVSSPGTVASNSSYLHVTIASSTVSFSSPGTYPTATTGDFSSVTEDFNGDGRPDLAIGQTSTTNGTSTLSVLIGDGEGGFGSRRDQQVSGSGLMSLAAGDFNGDGKLDIAAANSWVGVTILLGNGGGTFQPQVDYPTPPPHVLPHSVSAGDFNGDGHLDLAAIDFDGSGFVLVGAGDGTFGYQPSVSFSVYGHGVAVVSCDLNGDGILDLLAATDWGGGGYVHVYLGVGNGSFPEFTLYGAPAAEGLFAVAVADYNHDGKPDLAEFTGSSQWGHLTISLGRGSGAFQLLDQINLAAAGGLATGDFNGDGILDLALARVGSTYNPKSEFSILSGIGDGTFQPTLEFTVQSSRSPQWVAPLDLDDDGRLDLAAPGGERISVFLQKSLVDVFPRNISFSDQLVQTTSPSQTITLTNNLSTPLSVSSIDLTGADSADFAHTHNCPISPSTLAAGDSCTITVTFAPQTTGPKSASITINHDATGVPQQTFGLSGTSVNPAAVLSVSEIDFGTQTLLIKSPEHTVTLSNSGVGPLIITGIHTIGDYFAVTHDCGTSLAEGGHCTLTVTYTPQTVGTHSAVVAIYDNALSSPQIISLNGMAVPAALRLSTTSLEFGEQVLSTRSTPKGVVIKNPSTVPLLITGIQVTQSDFRYASLCPIATASIAPGEACGIEITFVPSNTGQRTGTFWIWDNATGSPHTVTLTGTGLPSARVSVAPASLDFGDENVGTTSAVQVVTVKNTASDPVLINNIVVTGDFTRAHDCPVSPATLPSSASCTVILSFRPTTPGTRTGTLTLSDNAVGSPHTVSLTGNGMGPGVSLSVAGLDFGGQIVGTSSAATSVTLTNSGTATLNISSLGVTGTNAGEFERTHNCGASLAAAANCTISVIFKPTSTGSKSAQAVVASNAQGNPHTVTLTGAGTDFALDVQSGGSTSATVDAGTTATYNLQIAPTGYSGNVALGCAFQGSTPRGANCSVAPSTLTLNGTDPGTFTVSVATTARSLAVPLGPNLPPASKPWGRHAVPLLLGLMTLMVAAKSRRVKEQLCATKAWVPLAATMLFVLLWAACGGGGSPPPQTGTPAGTYNLTLTAAAGGVSKTTSLTLKVN